MTISRRTFLTIAGSSAIILPASACTVSQDSARQPWHDAGQYEDPIRRTLSYAILAPNPHNRQPWVVDLLSATDAELYCDLDRLLPETDPYNRQIVIGLGCFLEQLRIAAAQFGFQANIDVFPDGASETALDSRPVAKISLVQTRSIQIDPLFAYILERHTNRKLYSDKTPEKNVLQAITQGLGTGTIARFTVQPEQVKNIRALTIDASNIEFDTRRTYMESVDVMRIGARQIRAQPDGLALEGPLLETLHTLGILTRKRLADQSSALFRTGRSDYAKGIKSAKAFVWITTPANTRHDQIRAGAAYLRLNLMATGEGLATHPLSQALQEYPEMKTALSQIHDALALHYSSRIQMLARIGYATKIRPSPRWPLEAKIRTE